MSNGYDFSDEEASRRTAGVFQEMDRTNRLTRAITKERRPLYKYLQRAHADALLNEGRIWVGTLEGFRAMEAARDVRGDQHDATAAFMESPPGQQTPDKFSSAFGMPVSFPAGALVEGNVFVRSVQHHDAFAYCMSHELSYPAAGKRDTCLEIVDFDGFLSGVSAALIEYCGQAGGTARGKLGAISYVDWLPGHLIASFNPGFRKHPSFGFEQEVRFIWTHPEPGPAKGCLVIRPELAKFFREVEIPPAQRSTY